MRYCTAILLAILLVPALLGAGPADDPLARLRPGHPRLLLTDEGLAAAMAAARSDPVRAALNRHIIATAEFILTAPPVRPPNNKESQEQDRYAVYYVLTTAMAYRLTGDERFLARAKRDLLTIAAFPDWNPRHFLSVGEMSFAAAIGYDWLNARLKPEERAIVKKALVEKSLSFAETIYGYSKPTTGKAAWSGNNTGNQNQVINAGLLSAALAIADEEPVLAREAIAGARKSMPHGMDAYAPDGGFPEGPGYWTYATSYSVIAIAELESALGTDLGLASSPGFDRTVNYYEAVQGPRGPVFNYADATDDLQNSPARAWLAKRFHQPFALRGTRSQLSDSLQREKIAKFDRGIQGTVVNRFFALHEVWFPDEPAGDVAELPRDSHFRGVADLATFRSAWNDTNAIFAGFKAGENDHHHNHLDLGSFVLDADGQRWAVDLGPEVDQGTYALPGYFDVKGRRWTYFRANNHSHNTVAPGEALQLHDDNASKRKVVAPIVAFGSAPERGFAIADLTTAYAGATGGLRRGIALLDRARVLVQDEYRPASSGTPLRWTMVTRTEVRLANDGRSAVLTAGGRTLRVEILAPANARLASAPARPPTAAENQNEGATLLSIEAVSEQNAPSTLLAVLLTPVGSKWPQLPPPKLTHLADWR